MSATYTTFAGQIVHETRNGTEHYYSPDTLGSTSLLMDTSGNVTDTFEYWPYGEERVRTGSTATPFTFVGALGYYKDLATRYYIRARYLMANYTRWLTLDPLWPRQLPDAYAASCPSRYIDGTGLAVELPLVLIAACGGCEVCIAAFALQCTNCGSDVKCWAQCLKGVLDNLPGWAKAICAGVCAGCIATIIVLLKPTPPGIPPPLLLPGTSCLDGCSFMCCVPYANDIIKLSACEADCACQCRANMGLGWDCRGSY